MSCGVDCRCASDPALLWLGCRPTATAPVGPLAWELPYALGVTLKSKKTKKRYNDMYSPCDRILQNNFTASKVPCAPPKALVTADDNSLQILARLLWALLSIRPQPWSIKTMKEGHTRKGTYIHVWLGHFAAQQKLAQLCKSTIL